MNVVENIINNQDDIIDYVQKNVDLEEVGKFVDSVISSKEEMENSTESNSFYGPCGKNNSIDNKTNENLAKNVIAIITLKTLSENKEISNFLKSIGVSYNFSKFFKINIQDECDCYAHVNEYEESENKFSGKVITYGILKDNEKENVDEKIKEKSKEEVEKYFKDNYDMKYEGGFSFELPNLDELNCESLLKSELFEVELDGDIKNKVEYTFSLNGKSKLKFFFRNEDFDCDLICTDVTYLTNGEYYKGDMKNFDRKGHGLYFNKKGLGIEGNYIDDYTIDGKVVIYNKKKEIIATKEYNKKNINDIIKQFENLA